MGIIMAQLIIAQRIIRRKGSPVAVRTGKVLTFSSVNDMIENAKRRRHVLSYLDNEGNEGTIRSGRMMRRVDSHVKNVTHSGLIL